MLHDAKSVRAFLYNCVWKMNRKTGDRVGVTENVMNLHRQTIAQRCSIRALQNQLSVYYKTVDNWRLLKRLVHTNRILTLHDTLASRRDATKHWIFILPCSDTASHSTVLVLFLVSYVLPPTHSCPVSIFIAISSLSVAVKLP